MRVSIAWVACVLALSSGVRAYAQEEGDTGSDQASESTDAEGAQEGEAAKEGEPAQAEGKDKANALRAWSFGPYVRYNVVPAFMLELLLDVAPSPAGPAFGAMASYRGNKDGPTFDMGIGYASYAFTGAFRTKGGVPNDTEWIESSLGLVHVTGSVLWEAKLAEPLTFLYGVGLDVGIVTGQMKRTEATIGPNGAWRKCPGPGLAVYCEFPQTVPPGTPTDPYNVKGEQYNVIDKSVPPLMGLPMLPHLALRYTPIDELSLRFDAAYGIVQFWFGLSAAYAPKL
jgi:hypothetical protein